MKCLSMMLLTTAVSLMVAQPVDAASVWASDVEAYSDRIQNFGVRGAGNGTLMRPATEFWLLGAPDAAVNAANNGLDPDHVAGWRSDAADQFIVVAFDQGILDVAGDDLVIRMFSGPNAGADVLASVDGLHFENVGSLGSGTPLNIRSESFDFAGIFDEPVQFIRIERVANGRQTGMFFDAFGATQVVPIPPAIVMFAPAVALMALAARRGSRRQIH